MSNSPVHPGMADQTKFDARAGAAKRPQGSFATKWGMTDQTKMSGLVGGASNLGTGPDASSPNPLDPEPRVKNLKRQPQALEAKWGMKDANGKGVDNSMAGKVLGEAILSGSSKLPDSVAGKTDSGAAPKPWPASDPN